MMFARALILVATTVILPVHAARPAPARKSAAKPAPAAAAPGVNDVANMKRALASTGTKKGPADPAKLDPNAALEVRGQSRTLSMMLVLKGGKESIDFIKVRQNYREEILATPY